MPVTRLPRPVGKFGRLPGKVPVGLRELGYYAAGPLPKAPASVAVPDVADWGMLGNGPDPSLTVNGGDPVGDCGVAGLEHGFMADAAMTGGHESEASSNQAVDFYLKFTGGADTGVVLSDYLAYVRRDGFFGHGVTAFAPVAVHDVPTLQFATWAYGFAYTGIVVYPAMQQAFANQQPWTTDLIGYSSPIGGHCIPIVGFDDNYLYAVTWGAVQAISYSMWHQIADEAWAIVTSELIARGGDGRGVSLPALRADLQQLSQL